MQTVRSQCLRGSSLGELTFSFSRTKCCPVLPSCAVCRHLVGQHSQAAILVGSNRTSQCRMRVALETLLLPGPALLLGSQPSIEVLRVGSVMLQAKWDRLTGQPKFIWQTDTSWFQLEQVVQ